MESVPQKLYDVFDDSHYASSLWSKMVRAFQLGPKYYTWDYPRYLLHRAKQQLPIIDWRAAWNPAMEFCPRVSQLRPLPDGYPEALQLLRDAGVKITMPRYRLEPLLGAWWSTRDISGDLIECGAYLGATSLLLATLSRLNSIHKEIYCLDSFQGMPDTAEYDVSRRSGEYTPHQDQVQILRRQADLLGVSDNLQIVKGLFSDSFTKLARRDLNFSFVLIDANLFSSTWDACEFTIPRTTDGGIVVFDDYNGVCDLGARLAIDSYLFKRRSRPSLLAGSSALLQIGDLSSTFLGSNPTLCSPNSQCDVSNA